MKSKVVVVLCSSDEQVIRTGIMYGTNALKKNWFEDVKFIIFGGGQEVLLKNTDLLNSLLEFKPLACKFVADEKGIGDMLSNKGLEVVYVGETLSNLINEGWTPLVF